MYFWCNDYNNSFSTDLIIPSDYTTPFLFLVLMIKIIFAPCTFSWQDLVRWMVQIWWAHLQVLYQQHDHGSWSPRRLQKQRGPPGLHQQPRRAASCRRESHEETDDECVYRREWWNYRYGFREYIFFLWCNVIDFPCWIGRSSSWIHTNNSYLQNCICMAINNVMLFFGLK